MSVRPPRSAPVSYPGQVPLRSPVECPQGGPNTWSTVAVTGLLAVRRLRATWLGGDEARFLDRS